MKEVLIFAAGLLIGAGIGGGVTYYVVNKKANERADEEILSVKEAFKNRKPLDISKIKEELKEEVEKETKAKVNLNKPSIMAYNSLAAGYSSQDEEPPKDPATVEVEDEDEVEDTSLEFIPPEEYGEKDGYRTVELYWYADEILATENHEKVDSPKDYAGDFVDHFGEYEDDAVYVRDNLMRRDISILRSAKTYYEELEDIKNRAQKRRLKNSPDSGKE